MVKRPGKFPIDVSIPAANDTGAEDQEPMRKNFENIQGFLSVDHVAPGTTVPANISGKHKQITFEEYHPPGKPIDPVSVAYTNVGIEDDSHPQHFWRNSQGIFPLSGIRAFGLINGKIETSTGGPSLISKLNLTGITYKEVQIPQKVNNKNVEFPFHRFNITVQANAVFGKNPTLIVSPEKPVVNMQFSYTDNVISVFFPKTSFFTDPTKFSVLLLQI